jgi:23S rRNA pseudouridine1911/1915/1917 synthase
MRLFKVKVKPQLDRIDQFVSSEIKELTRSKTKKLIKDGFILVNNSQVDPSYKVRKGDSVKIEIPVQKKVELKAENIPLNVIFEDEYILVVDKQPGLVVHPTLDHPSGTLVNALLSHLDGMVRNDKLRPGIVHRLDKDTSGLIVVAKNQEALDKLKKQFQDRSVHKKYLALVHGEIVKEVGEIVKGIERHPKFKSKFITSEDGKDAKTIYRVLTRFGKKFTLLEIEPLTGRTHQLRVHFSDLGHPIVGDKLYGGKMLLPRQFLHAEKLEFTHPLSGKKLVFQSKLPEDLEKFLNKIKENKL